MVVDHRITIEQIEEDIQLRCDCGGWFWYVPSFDRRLAYYGLMSWDKHCAKEKTTVDA
jgi:hypothetical protein